MQHYVSSEEPRAHQILNVFDLPHAPRARGIKRTARYANVLDDQGQPRKGRDLWDRKWSETHYWRDYLNLKPAEYYDAHPDEDKIFRREFEAKMRMPLHLFQQLADEMQREMPEREPCVPIKVKLAAAIRYLSLGCAWDGIEDIFNVSRVVLSDWYKTKFVPFMMRPGGHYERNVRLPTTPEEVGEMARMYEGAGLPGCVGSMDGVHIIWHGCPAGQAYLFKGWKEKHPTFNFNVTVDFNGLPIYVSDWFPGATNDKLMLDADDLHHAILTDPLFTQFQFTCMGRDGEHITVLGAYLICDNGYKDLPTLQRPIRHALPGSIDQAWVDHVESMRKDVECTFGVNKKMFAILKHGIFIRDVHIAADTVKVCFALRRMIYDAKGEDALDPTVQAAWKTMDDTELASMKESARPRRAPPSQEMPGEDEEEAVVHTDAAQRRRILMDHFDFYKRYRAEEHRKDKERRRRRHEAAGLLVRE